jgi:hypothetical protein
MGGGLDILGGRGGVFASTIGGVLVSAIGTHLASGEHKYTPFRAGLYSESAKQVLERSHLTAFSKPTH